LKNPKKYKYILFPFSKNNKRKKISNTNKKTINKKIKFTYKKIQQKTKTPTFKKKIDFSKKLWNSKINIIEKTLFRIYKINTIPYRKNIIRFFQIYNKIHIKLSCKIK
jgi:hypothetical protein